MTVVFWKCCSMHQFAYWLICITVCSVPLRVHSVTELRPECMFWKLKSQALSPLSTCCTGNSKSSLNTLEISSKCSAGLYCLQNWNIFLSWFMTKSSTWGIRNFSLLSTSHMMRVKFQKYLRLMPDILIMWRSAILHCP